MRRVGTAFAMCGDTAGYITAVLKLIHEVQHEIGDVATLVQYGMRYDSVQHESTHTHTEPMMLSRWEKSAREATDVHPI